MIQRHLWHNINMRFHARWQRKWHCASKVYREPIQNNDGVIIIVQSKIRLQEFKQKKGTLLKLTLQCITATWRGSALSQLSMALQMVQILSKGGACMSGQPVSRVCNRRTHCKHLPMNHQSMFRHSWSKFSGLTLGFILERSCLLSDRLMI